MAFGSVLLAVPGIRQPLVGLLDAVSLSDGVAIRDAIRSYGFVAPAASIALILLHMVIPLPAELMALANGLPFGFWGGLAVSWSGFMLSALLMYAAGRLWGRPLLDRAVPRRRRERLDSWLEQEGAFTLLAVRLVPLVPFNTVCLAAGVIRASLWTYVWTTGVGILPLGTCLSLLEPLRRKQCSPRSHVLGAERDLSRCDTGDLVDRPTPSTKAVLTPEAVFVKPSIRRLTRPGRLDAVS